MKVPQSENAVGDAQELHKVWRLGSQLPVVMGVGEGGVEKRMWFSSEVGKGVLVEGFLTDCACVRVCVLGGAVF